MTTPKQPVKVSIGGEEFTVRSEFPAEYTREVAAYFDAQVFQVRNMVPTLDGHRAVVLAALAITDELFQARRGDREMASRLAALADDLARLLPPVKRTGRATGGSAVPAE